jgi:hypothetical protein
MDPADLLEDLEIVCLDAIRGDPPGPQLAARLTAVVTGWLHARGIAARVEATSTRRGTAVKILLGKPGARVRELILTVGQG